MCRKHAELTSKTEAIKRMLNGETFYSGSLQVIRYQEFSSDASFHYGGIPFNCVSKDVWDNFRHWDVEI